jgi:hypothetical protein
VKELGPEQARRLAAWGLYCLTEALDRVVAAYRKEQAHERRYKEMMESSRRQPSAYEGRPKGQGSQPTSGSPMLRAIDRYIEEHEAEDGRQICRKFNLHGYSLRIGMRRPEPCDGKCPRAHIQVPAELVTDGRQERRWEGEAGSGKARPKRK